MQGPYLRQYGEATKVNFGLYEPDGSDLKTDAAHAAGDTKLLKDEGDEANTANDFVDEGQGYSLVLTASEMQAARVVLFVVDQSSPKAWLDTTIVIETYGHTSAQHAFDVEKAVKLLTNKAVQNKATGAIEYFDDDGQSVILTHTPTESESSLTRTPS
jgi:hypothetical protein